ncbi:hypothetical protein B0T26DRAFT_493507 [Lasiosphaeria miniovina]|uniref:Uncharacterized protein n=1 Tax=Lasiosphaeria miniovina TaxID=1954250 RepID=A0AA39ZTG3_9PEZI|nr:uncharacterized protein B0T26DRAFT_493507 [Lasiosphaeria miniovina]KAK0703253.1 hypothetical protein B0T26DRAFT_493507 [Lasiosphaeria miniovina]
MSNQIMCRNMRPTRLPAASWSLLLLNRPSTGAHTGNRLHYPPSPAQRLPAQQRLPPHQIIEAGRRLQLHMMVGSRPHSSGIALEAGLGVQSAQQRNCRHLKSQARKPVRSSIPHNKEPHTGLALGNRPGVFPHDKEIITAHHFSSPGAA